jgi:hypothetical protein
MQAAKKVLTAMCVVVVPDAANISSRVVAMAGDGCERRGVGCARAAVPC